MLVRREVASLLPKAARCHTGVSRQWLLWLRWERITLNLNWLDTKYRAGDLSVKWRRSDISQTLCRHPAQGVFAQSELSATHGWVSRSLNLNFHATNSPVGTILKRSEGGLPLFFESISGSYVLRTDVLHSEGAARTRSKWSLCTSVLQVVSPQPFSLHGASRSHIGKSSGGKKPVWRLYALPEASVSGD